MKSYNMLMNRMVHRIYFCTFHKTSLEYNSKPQKALFKILLCLTLICRSLGGLILIASMCSVNFRSSALVTLTPL